MVSTVTIPNPSPPPHPPALTAILPACYPPVIKNFLIKEGNVLFNDSLNTFYLRLHGIKHMVKDHSDSERGNLLPSTRATLFNEQQGFFYMHHPTDRTTHTTAFCYTSRGALAGTRNSSMGPLREGSIRRPIAPWAKRSYHGAIHLAPQKIESTTICMYTCAIFGVYKPQRYVVIVVLFSVPAWELPEHALQQPWNRSRKKKQHTQKPVDGFHHYSF